MKVRIQVRIPMLFDIILTYEKLVIGNWFDVIMFRIIIFIIHFHYIVYSIPPVNFTSSYSLLLGNQQCTTLATC